MNKSIRNQIDFFYKEIEKMTKDTFVLNEQVKSYYKQIENLQSICSHKFENGKCVYCDFQD